MKWVRPCEEAVGTPFGLWTRPVGPEYVISQPYGYDPEYDGNAEHVHYGRDWKVGVGTFVLARDDGEVLWAAVGPIGFPKMLDRVLGLCMMQTCDSTPGQNSRLGHLSALFVKVGDRVTKGQIIGLSGDSGLPGFIFGAHLHEERVVGAERLDPAECDLKAW